ncbi:transposase [Streptomyces sp. NPDC050585]|uniref:transposase n=1 Tax=Streptomyces sp. NPDC050585 TaxID=3365632 RepID=UPI0037A1268C
MRGLIAPLERKNGWTLVEEAGHAGPDRIHRLLNGIEWDAEEVLEDVRDYDVEHLADPDAVLIVDDTGFLQKGIRSAGVRRAVLRYRRMYGELPDRRLPRLRASRERTLTGGCICPPPGRTTGNAAAGPASTRSPS